MRSNYKVWMLFALLVISCTTVEKSGVVNGKSTDHVIDTNSNYFKLTDLFKKIQPILSSKTETKKTIAIMGFSNDYPLLSQYIRDVFSETSLSQGILRIIERSDLEKILEEQNLQLSGIIDDATAKKVGNIIGVDYLCYGNIVDVNTYMRLFAKIVEIETGEIVGIGSTNIDKTDDIISLLKVDKKVDKIEREQRLASIKNWKVIYNKNEFDGTSVFTFKVKGPERGQIILGYVKNNDPSRSYIRIGINDWPFTTISDPYYAKFDIKVDDGSIVNRRLDYIYWDEKVGKVSYSGKEYNIFIDEKSNRELFEFVYNNAALTIRRDDKVIRFNVDGLKEVLESYGIVYEEIDLALKNEEF